MAGRIRSIKPEILEDEKCARLSHLAYRLFVGTWLIADDFGNLRGDPEYVRAHVLWASRETRETVAKALEELAESSLLSPYSVRGQSYLHVLGWSKHQKVDKPGKPRMPGPDQDDTKSNRVVANDSRESREEFAGVSRESRGSLEPDHDHDRDQRARETPLATIPPAPVSLSVPGYNPDQPGAKYKLAEQVYAQVSALRVTIAAELKLPAQLPFPIPTPASRPLGIRDLLERVTEEGPSAPVVCARVLSALAAQARAAKSIEWVSPKAFTAGGWRTAREYVPAASAGPLRIVTAPEDDVPWFPDMPSAVTP
jgi:hypothetical protein